MAMPSIGRRKVLRVLAACAAAMAVPFSAVPRSRARAASSRDAELESRWPALRLRIGESARLTAGELDFKHEFGAVGDGQHDDGPAVRALAAAVNAGQVPAGTVAVLAPGRFRVVGDETVVFRRTIVLRGSGPDVTIIQPEYAAQRSVFLRAQGAGMYVRHSTGHYSSGPDQNRYPNAPYIAVREAPRRGDRSVQVENPSVFSPGDQAYLLCDDYGNEIVYQPTNRRLEQFILKQYLRVEAVDGDTVILDAPVRHDFVGAQPRLYRWRPLAGFGLEHLTIDDRSTIADTEAFNTFRAVHFDGLIDSWIWDVHFLNNTSVALTVGRSRRCVVSECLFDGARHVGGGGNGYLPELSYTDDSLVEYCTSLAGRHALICGWSNWGNVFRYNRVIGTPNTETHGEYNVENLYLRNDARGSRMEFGGGGNRVHGHDGPFNELRENYARVMQVLKPNDRENRLIDNWHVEPVVDEGQATVLSGNLPVSPDWDEYPYAAYCGHDHAETAETAVPQSRM